MGKFIEKLEIGEVHKRDQWQFEIKSDFFPSETGKPILYTQEYYLFIPNALQINRETYTKEAFYRDLTNLIRYKTPHFTFDEILDPENHRSPLNKLDISEIKLLGNIYRSTLRGSVAVIAKLIKKNAFEEANKRTRIMGENIEHIKKRYAKYYTVAPKDMLIHLQYGEEFITNTTHYFLTELLNFLIETTNSTKSDSLRETLIELLQKEDNTKESKTNPKKDEYILYRSSLLNKYMLDVLLLNTSRSSLDKRFRTLIGSLSAGLAMLFFFVLFVMQGEVFIINSLPFITATVLLYILKDRLKEELRFFSIKYFTKWFSDYSTKIRTFDNTLVLGKMDESFSFVNESKIPPAISKARNREFHEILEEIKRPERVIYYKKKIKLFPYLATRDVRREALNIIFRFDLHYFVSKADNPERSYLSFDRSSGTLKQQTLPKVYHLNMLLKNTYFDEGVEVSQMKKYRIVLNKAGIVRIETITQVEQPA